MYAPLAFAEPGRVNVELSAKEGMAEGGNVVVHWPVFGDDVRAEAIEWIAKASNMSVIGSVTLAKSLINGLVTGRFTHALGMLDDAQRDLCDLWRDLCVWVENDFAGAPKFADEMECRIRANYQRAYAVASCVAAACARAGLPLAPPFDLHPQGRLYRIDPIGSPLCTAVKHGSVMVNALLDLPLSCGVNVSAPNGGAGDGPALGYTNFDPRVTPELFRRLLSRTERAAVSGGVVYVEQGRAQCRYSNVHVLISNILLCTYDGHFWPSIGFQRVNILIASAHPDGNGTDLTAGSAIRGHSGDFETGPTGLDLWPDGNFYGALELVNTLYRFHIRNSKQRALYHAAAAEATEAKGRLAIVQNNLIATLQLARHYRRSIQPLLANRLAAGGIHMPELHTLVAAYIIVPLAHESQLQHPLLDQQTTNTPQPTHTAQLSIDLT